MARQRNTWLQYQILKEEKVTVSELLKQVLRDCLSSHRPSQTVLERTGGVPKEVLSETGLPENLSDRDVRRSLMAEHVCTPTQLAMTRYARAGQSTWRLLRICL